LFGGYLFVGRLEENPRIRKPGVVVQIRSAVAYVGEGGMIQENLIFQCRFQISQSLTHDNDTEQSSCRRALFFLVTDHLG
jgi:hypothetical protein